MNLVRFFVLCAALVLVAALLGCGDDHPNAAGTSGTASPEFKEAAQVWGKVLAAKATFDDVVKDGKWKSVHEAAFGIRDEAYLLADASKTLSAENLDSVKAHVKHIAQLAADLDEAGDAGNGEKVLDLAKQMDAAIDAIPPLYPEGALPKEASGKAGLSGEGGHSHE